MMRRSLLLVATLALALIAIVLVLQLIHIDDQCALDRPINAGNRPEGIVPPLLRLQEKKVSITQEPVFCGQG